MPAPQNGFSREQMNRVNVNNPIQGNRFAALSQSPVRAVGRGLVQRKVTAYATKRSFGEIEGGAGTVPSPKRSAPGNMSYAQKLAGEVGAGISLNTLDKSWSENVEEFVAPSAAELDAAGNSKSLSLSEEMANLSELVEKDGSPIYMALLLFLNKLNEGLDAKEKRIVVLEKEVMVLNGKIKEKELFANKAGVEKERSALSSSIDNSLKTVRIVGIERVEKNNKEVLDDVISKVNVGRGEGGCDFRQTKLHTSRNGKFSTVNLICHSVEQKLDVESQGRKAGLVVRQQLPAQLVNTCKDIREAYSKVVSYKEGHLMVKINNNHISVSHRQQIGKRWELIENLQLPASKRMLSLGSKQTLKSKVADLTKVFIPERYC